MLQITDFKNAFSARVNVSTRPLGPLLVQPCKELPLKSAELIELLRSVHGLDGAPIESHKTVTTEFVSGLGHRRSLLEPCWYFSSSSMNTSTNGTNLRVMMPSSFLRYTSFCPKLARSALHGPRHIRWASSCLDVDDFMFGAVPEEVIRFEKHLMFNMHVWKMG